MGEAPYEVQRIDSNVVAAMVASHKVPGDCWVVDSGLVYNPARRLFDHHHDGSLPSAAMLVFSEYFPELAGSELHKYFELVSRVDTMGPRSLNDVDVVDDSRSYWSFSQNIITQVFEQKPLAVLEIITAGLKDKIDFEEEKKAASEWLEMPGRLEPEDIDGLTVLVYREKPPQNVVNGLRSIDKALVDQLNAVAVYGFDKNNPSIRSLYRTDKGHDILDFARVEAPEILFSHQGGFLLRFIPSYSDEWKDLVSQARI